MGISACKGLHSQMCHCKCIWQLIPLCCLRPMSVALQRNTIRDLNTGHVYLLDTEEDITDLPSHSGYTDVVSGTKMSADEFDRALGLASYIGVKSWPQFAVLRHACHLFMQHTCIQDRTLPQKNCNSSNAALHTSVTRHCMMRHMTMECQARIQWHLVSLVMTVPFCSCLTFRECPATSA